MLHIRPETPIEYGKIAELHVQSSNDNTQEAVIVALLRQRKSFIPHLALVALDDEKIVGHTIFTPYTIWLMGQNVRALLLAPIAVDNDYDTNEVGKTLIDVGHKIGSSYGYDIGFIVGNSDYYPQFGYRMKAFGASHLEIDVPRYDEINDLERRKPKSGDLTDLMDLWDYAEGNVDFSVQPEESMLDWLGFHKSLQAYVYERDGEIVGYSRGTGDDLRIILAKNDDALRSMAYYLADGKDTITLPLHPNSSGAGIFGTSATISEWQNGMAIGLTDHGLDILDKYFDEVKQGKRQLGRPLWGTAFELASER